MQTHAKNICGCACDVFAVSPSSLLFMCKILFHTRNRIIIIIYYLWIAEFKRSQLTFPLSLYLSFSPLHLSFHACQRYICSSCFGNAVLSVFVSSLSLPVRDRTVSPRFQLVHMFHCAFLDNPSTCGNYTSAYAITPLLWLFFQLLYYPLSFPLCQFDEEQTHSAKHFYLRLSFQRWRPETLEDNSLSIVPMCWACVKMDVCFLSINCMDSTFVLLICI